MVVEKVKKNIRISDLKNHVGKNVRLDGWVYNKRSSGKIWFIIIRDGTGYSQGVVIKENVSDKVFLLEPAITIESSLSVSGIVKKDKRSIGGYELDITNIKVIQISEDYPISKKEHGTAFLMDNRHLWIRSKKQNAILRIRAEITKSIRHYFDSNGFLNLDTPIFTSNACEGTTTLFKTDYFGQKAFLSQSGQLYNEANIMSFGKVYCFGPTFRAEKSKTRRHLNEFWMVEPEMAYATLEDVIDLSEQLVFEVVQHVLSKRKEELQLLERDTSILEKLQIPFPRISYAEAADLLKAQGLSFEWGGDFGSPDETALANHFKQPVFVHRFPKATKAFYMKADPEKSELSLSVDLLAPEGYGEIIGGGQREDNYEILEAKIKDSNLPEESFQWYLDLRRYGSVPHGGFGMGIERVVSWICGLDHVRESIPYPRMLHRLKP